MKLSGKELKRVHSALLEAYPDRDSLQKMLLFEVDRELDVIAPEGSLDAVVFAVINRAQRENWLRLLVSGAHSGNPANQPVAEIHAWFESLPGPKTEDEHFNVCYMYDREPLFGRPQLRKHARTLSRPIAGARIFVVDGDPVSGKSYTVNYISYLKENVGGFKFALVDLRELTRKMGGKLHPPDVGESIAWQLGLNVKSMPAWENEQAARWSQFYCDWFISAIENVDEYSWIVIDECHTYLRQDTRDLIFELAQRIALQLETVRLVLLHQKKTDLPLNVLSRIEEERIQAIGEAELVEFFRSIHGRVRADLPDDDFEDRIAESVAKVLRVVDRKDERWLQAMSMAAGNEAALILGGGRDGG